MPKFSGKSSQIIAVSQKYRQFTGVATLVQYCLQENVWDAQEQQAMVLQAAKRLCADALKTILPTGLPYAEITRHRHQGAHMWLLIGHHAEDSPHCGGMSAE